MWFAKNLHKNILEECGLWPGSGNETYEVSNQNKGGIIDKLKQGVSFFNIKQSDCSRDDLPYIYSIIKMHKKQLNSATLFLQDNVPLNLWLKQLCWG